MDRVDKFLIFEWLQLVLLRSFKWFKSVLAARSKACWVLCISSFLVACSPNSNQVGASQLAFTLMLNGQPISCSDPAEGVIVDGQHWQLDQLKLFVHDLSIQQGDKSKNIELTTNGWQAHQVGLVSLEPECGGSKIENNEETNHALVFKIPVDLQNAESLSFRLGVPFELNHQNPLTQPSPLNLPLMFWSWQMGHKFVRWDMSNDIDTWSFHLGSLGCESASVVRSPAQPCSEPNVVSVTLDSPKSNANEVHIHLDRIIQNIKLSSDNSCTLHGATESSCQQLIDNLTNNRVFEWY